MISLIGKTDVDGRVTTSNKLLFNNLYNLPSIPFTSADSPDILGHFTFSDSVTIALSDESFSTLKLYYREINDGENKINLNWDEGIIQPDNNIINRDIFSKDVMSKDSVSIPTNWKLYQNYPNPFN